MKEDCSAANCKKYFVISHNENVICLICQNTIAAMKDYNIKHYCTKRDGTEAQLPFDEIEQFKKSLIMQEVFHAYEKDIKLVRELSFEISKVIQEKGQA